ncbi:MAG: DUF3445 domain-containing protein [Pseudomonadota bacterium]
MLTSLSEPEQGSGGETILQSALHGAPWEAPQTAGLPGTEPCAQAAWLTIDDAYAGQMRLRATLIERRRTDVIAALPGSEATLEELYGFVLRSVSARPDFSLKTDGARDDTPVRAVRPDGVPVTLDAGDPLATLGRLVAEDLCVLQRVDGDAGHRLTAAVLCFPAHWSLQEKLGRTMARIHAPVEEYDAHLERRVQRMLDALRPGLVLTRMNCLPSVVPDLFTPQTEADEAAHSDPHGPYLRSERQCLWRLPETGAVAFSIQTRMVRRSDLTPAQRAGYARWRAAQGLP